MQINKISNISFYSRIIDAHVHIGNYNGQNYTKSQVDTFVKSPLPNNDNIEKVLVSNLDVLTTAKDEYSGNLQTLREINGDKKYEIFASCSPKNGDVENIKKLFSNNRNTFIGLKFHPTAQDLPITNSKYEAYLEFAQKKKLPCLFHTAVNVDENGLINMHAKDISDPENIYLLAKKYKQTPIVMAHLGAGHNEAHDKAIEVLIESIKNEDANLYADISWVDIGLEHNGEFPEGEHRSKEHILKAIKKLKGIGDPHWKYGDQSYRLMFGSDAPIDRFSGTDAIEEYTKFIEDIKFAIRNDNDLKASSEEIIDNLFYTNAKKLYLDPKSAKKKSAVIRKGAICAVCISIGALILSNDKILNISEDI